MSPHRLIPFLCCLAPLAAPASAQVVDRVERSWTQELMQPKPRALVPLDLDADRRDDAVFVLDDGTMIRAANPGVLDGLSAFSTHTDVVDAVAVRRTNDRDVLVTVGSTNGLALHGTRDNGSVLSVVSTTTAWQDVTQLRVFLGGRFPLLAGLIAGGTAVRVAALDLASLTFNQVRIVQFPAPLLDFDFAAYAGDAYPHLVGLTATSIVRIGIDAVPRSTVPNLLVGEGAMVRMPNGSQVAVVSRAPNAPGTKWELVLESHGVLTSVVVLDFSGDVLLDGMNVRDIDVGFLDDDGEPDLLIGQSVDGRAAVLFGAAGGDYAVARRSVIETGSNGIAGTAFDAVPPRVARVDGDLRDGVFHLGDLDKRLVVHHRVPTGQQNFLGSSIVPTIEGEPDYVETTNSQDELGIELRIPGPLREWASSAGLDELQITVWTVSNVVDVNGNYTGPSAALEFQVRGDYHWTLQGFSSGTADIVYALDIPVAVSAAEFQMQRKHVMMLVRLANVDTSTSAGMVTAASFTTPIWFSKDWDVINSTTGVTETRSTRLFEEPSLQGVLFDPQDPAKVVRRRPGGTGVAKNIGRLIKAKPVPPPLEEPPAVAPLQNRGQLPPLY